MPNSSIVWVLLFSTTSLAQPGRTEVMLSWHKENPSQGLQSFTVKFRPQVWTWQQVTPANQNEDLARGDIDRDGDIDVVGGTEWFRNDGNRWTKFSIGNYPGKPDRVRLADINGNGRLDIVIGYENFQDGRERVAVYFQPPDPRGVWPEKVIASLIGPMSLDIGDFDRDGRPDVVVGEHRLATNASKARVVILKNPGNTTSNWTEIVAATGEEHHDGTQIADFDQDGDLDIVSISWRNSKIVPLYENTSKGPSLNQMKFRHQVIDNSSSRPINPHVKGMGDFDADGDIDVIVASSHTDYLVWYEYPGWKRHTIRSGSKTPYTTDGRVVDFNQDGFADFLTSRGNGKGSAPLVFLNPGRNGDPRIGVNWREVNFGPASSHDVLAHDLNRDGLMDGIFRGPGGAVSVFFQMNRALRGPQDFQKILLNDVNPIGNEGALVADLTRDGCLDIILNGGYYQNPCDAAAMDPRNWKRRIISTRVSRDQKFADAGIQVADIDHDGIMEVFWVAAEAADQPFFYSYTQDPINGPWNDSAAIDARVSYAHTFQKGDMNQDGKIDFIVAEMHQSSQARIMVYYNNGNKTFTRRIYGTTGSHNIRVGDIGNDGDLDIFGTNWNSGAPNRAIVEFWENQTETNHRRGIGPFTKHLIDANKPGGTSLFVRPGDLNGDGYPDVVTGPFAYINSGSIAGTWQRKALGSRLNNAALLHDFDHDGDLDVLASQGVGAGTNTLFGWAENDGKASFTPRYNISTRARGDFLQGITAVEGFLPPPAPVIEQNPIRYYMPNIAVVEGDFLTADTLIAVEWQNAWIIYPKEWTLNAGPRFHVFLVPPGFPKGTYNLLVGDPTIHPVQVSNVVKLQVP